MTRQRVNKIIRRSLSASVQRPNNNDEISSDPQQDPTEILKELQNSIQFTTEP
eukprot:UN01197